VIQKKSNNTTVAVILMCYRKFKNATQKKDRWRIYRRTA